MPKGALVEGCLFKVGFYGMCCNILMSFVHGFCIFSRAYCKQCEDCSNFCLDPLLPKNQMLLRALPYFLHQSETLLDIQLKLKKVSKTKDPKPFQNLNLPAIQKVLRNRSSYKQTRICHILGRERQVVILQFSNLQELQSNVY